MSIGLINVVEGGRFLKQFLQNNDGYDTIKEKQKRSAIYNAAIPNEVHSNRTTSWACPINTL